VPMDEDYIPDEVRVWIMSNGVDVATVLIWLHRNPKIFNLILGLASLEGLRDEIECATADIVDT
jgi:hypothetical protein